MRNEHCRAPRNSGQRGGLQDRAACRSRSRTIRDGLSLRPLRRLEPFASAWLLLPKLCLFDIRTAAAELFWAEVGRLVTACCCLNNGAEFRGWPRTVEPSCFRAEGVSDRPTFGLGSSVADVKRSQKKKKKRGGGIRGFAIPSNRHNSSLSPAAVFCDWPFTTETPMLVSV